jgi:hypothetical protein
MLKFSKDMQVEWAMAGIGSGEEEKWRRRSGTVRSTEPIVFD